MADGSREVLPLHKLLVFGVLTHTWLQLLNFLVKIPAFKRETVNSWCSRPGDVWRLELAKGSSIIRYHSYTQSTSTSIVRILNPQVLPIEYRFQAFSKPIQHKRIPEKDRFFRPTWLIYMWITSVYRSLLMSAYTSRLIEAGSHLFLVWFRPVWS